MLSFVGRRPFVRERILEAAFDLFARRGYEAVSTREIAAAAKVGHASMYRHFASKEELGRVLYGQALEPLQRTVADLEAEAVAWLRMLYGAYDQRPRALALLIFPPHDFTPWELDRDNDEAIRNRFQRLFGLDDDRAAIAWGAMTGPIQDRYLHRRSGAMLPYAEAHAAMVESLLEGTSS